MPLSSSSSSLTPFSSLLMKTGREQTALQRYEKKHISWSHWLRTYRATSVCVRCSAYTHLFVKRCYWKTYFCGKTRKIGFKRHPVKCAITKKLPRKSISKRVRTLESIPKRRPFRLSKCGKNFACKLFSHSIVVFFGLPWEWVRVANRQRLQPKRWMKRGIKRWWKEQPPSFPHLSFRRNLSLFQCGRQKKCWTFKESPTRVLSADTIARIVKTHSKSRHITKNTCMLAKMAGNEFVFSPKDTKALQRSCVFINLNAHRICQRLNATTPTTTAAAIVTLAENMSARVCRWKETFGLSWIIPRKMRRHPGQTERIVQND